jgi:hypothetical protein
LQQPRSSQVLLEAQPHKGRATILIAAASILALGVITTAIVLSKASPPSSSAPTAPNTSGFVIPARAWITRTGRFTTTQICKTNQNLRYKNAIIDVPNGIAFTLEGNCDIELIDTEIRARIGIESKDSGIGVSMQDGSITASETGISLSMSTIKLKSVQITAPSGIITTDPTTLSIIDSKLEASGTAVTCDHPEFQATGTTLRGKVGLLATGAGSAHFSGGSIIASEDAFNVSGIIKVETQATRIEGKRRIGGLSTVVER